MTNAEAKEILDHNWTKLVNPDYSDEELGEAQNLAIEALSEPTIPSSVIEKITETMEEEYASADELANDRLGGGYETKASYYRGKANGITWVKGIIDNAVKECTHEV